MLKFANRWILGLLLLGLCTGAASAQTRIGTIDLRKAFDNYWKKKQAEANLKSEKDDVDKELKSQLDDLKKAKEAYQKLLNDANDQAVSSEEREKRKKLAEDKLKQAKDIEDTAVQYERQQNTVLNEKRQRVRDNLISEIRNIVNAKAREHGFTMVFDTAAETVNGTPVMLYNTTDADITDEVLKELNAAAPATDIAKPDEKRDEKSGKKDQKKK